MLIVVQEEVVGLGQVMGLGALVKASKSLIQVMGLQTWLGHWLEGPGST